MKYLAEYFQELERMDFKDRQLALAKGVIAGNVFDWGAREVTQIMETQSFGFKEATEKLQGSFVILHFKIIKYLLAIIIVLKSLEIVHF